MSLESLLISFGDVVILQPTVKLSEVNNPMCRRFLQACDGRKTIAEIESQFHLDAETGARVVRRCFERGWAEFKSIDDFNPIWQVLITQLGSERASQVILQAVETNRRNPKSSLATVATEGLFAIEMQLTQEEQEVLAPQLEALHESYRAKEAGSPNDSAKAR